MYSKNFIFNLNESKHREGVTKVSARAVAPIAYYAPWLYRVRSCKTHAVQKHDFCLLHEWGRFIVAYTYFTFVGVTKRRTSTTYRNDTTEA